MKHLPGQISVACIMFVLVACGPGPDDRPASMPEEATEIVKEETIVNQAEQDRRIDYIEFLTTDMNRIKNFYAAVFGWKFTDYGPDYASFSDGRLAGGFSLAPEISTGGPLVVLYSLDLEQIESAVKDAGGKVVREIFEFPGGRRFHFKDPDGNELAIWSDK